jgi:hypothetical protein
LEETIERKKSALRTMLEMMDVPARRLDLDRKANMWWLGRNLGINNSAHPLFQTASELIVWIQRAMVVENMKRRKKPVC